MGRKNKCPKSVSACADPLEEIYSYVRGLRMTARIFAVIIPTAIQQHERDELENAAKHLLELFPKPEKGGERDKEMLQASLFNMDWDRFAGALDALQREADKEKEDA